MKRKKTQQNSAKLGKEYVKATAMLVDCRLPLWPRPSAPFNSRSPWSHVILAISIEIGSELAFGHSRLAEPEIGDERPTRIAASELYARYEAWSGKVWSR